MSTGKGSIQQGAPTTTVNPAQVSQQPYLDYGYQQAQNLYQNQPQQAYPGQSYAPTNPYTTQGYSDIYATGQSIDQNLRPIANQAWTNAASGNYQSNPAYGGYQSYADGTSYPQSVQQSIASTAIPTGNEYAGQVNAYGQAAANTGGQYASQTAGYANPAAASGQYYAGQAGRYAPQAAASGQYYSGQTGQYAPQAAVSGQYYAGQTGQYAPQAAASGQYYSGQAGQYAPQQAAYAGQLGANSNLGLSQLGQTALGAYLPGQAGANPYLQPTIDAALDPLNRNYQTVTAPTTSAAASASGRYGSGAQAGMVNTNEQNYLEQAGDIASKMSYDVYNAERQRQDAAAQAYGSQYQAGLTGAITGLGQAGTTAINAGNLANQGYSTAGNISQAAGNLANQGYQTAGNVSQAAGNLANQGYQTAGNVTQAAGNLANQGYQNAGNLATQAGGTANAGYNTGANAASTAGGLSFRGLDTAGTAANNYAANQQYGLNSMSNAFNTANTNQISAAQMYPQIAAAQYSAPNAAVTAGQGLTTQQQAEITGQMTDWQRQQQQDYINLNNYMASIGAGNPVGGSNTVTKSAYTDPFASALSGVAGAAGIAGSLGWTPFAASAGGLGLSTLATAAPFI